MNPGKRAARAVAGSLCAVLLLAPVTALAAAEEAPSICEGAPTGAFSDVRPGSTHAANIDCLAAYGVTRGVGGGNYDPSGPVPREQMTSFLINFLGVALDGQLTPPIHTVAFTDVVGQTHAANVVRAAERGIALGRTPTTFEPRRPVTRGQMASFVARTLGVAGHTWPVSLEDHFRDDDSTTHEQSINRLAAARVVQGRGPGRFEPGQHITRAQMATFLVNAAQVLADQGRWSASLVELEAPSVQLVRRPGDSMEEIEITWDRPVALVGSASEIEVLDAGGEVAASATGAAHDDALTVVTLAVALEHDEVYWLRLGEGLVESDEGATNAAATAAFTFSALSGAQEDDEDGDEGDDEGGDEAGSEDGDEAGSEDGDEAGEEDPAADVDGGVDGDAGDGPAVVVPSITGVETDPANDQLIVRFDTEVACPDTTAARTAWHFSNASIIEDGTHATGAPDGVTQAGHLTDTCYLQYGTDGVEDGDFGMLRYHAPDADAAAVTTASGGHLETVDDLRVVDTVPPQLLQIKPRSETSVVELRFSEPVICVSLQSEDFIVGIDSGESDLPVDSFTCDAFDSEPVLVLASGSISFSDSVTVSLVGEVYDQSGDNTAPQKSLTAFAL